MWSPKALHCFPEEFQCIFAIPALGDIAFKHLSVLQLPDSKPDTKSFFRVFRWQGTGSVKSTLLAGLAQFERELMLERQREGIARAKAEGKYKGRWNDYLARRPSNKFYSDRAFLLVGKVRSESFCMQKLLSFSRHASSLTSQL
jgi:hypothetical protein